MDHISTLLPKVLKKRGLMHQVNASLVIHHAQQWINRELPELREQLFSKTFKDGILSIESKNSTAAQECHMHLEELSAYLREECKHPQIEEIRIVRSS